MTTKTYDVFPVSTQLFVTGEEPSSVSQEHLDALKLRGVSTVDFHTTTKCSQACPYCWGPRRIRNAVSTNEAKQIINRIRELGARRIVFTGGDPLQRPDAVELVQYAKQIGLETALSTTGDLVTPELLAALSPYLDLISLPLDGSTEEVNSRTKHRGHYAAVMRALGRLRSYPNIDVKVCTPVTNRNYYDVPAIAELVEEYSRITEARVFYNVFQAFPRAMFSVKWDRLIVSDQEFTQLKRKVGNGDNITINFLNHDTLDRLYVMVFPNGNMIVPSGSDYPSFGRFVEVEDFDLALRRSQFDAAKHLRHSRGWEKIFTAAAFQGA